MSEPLDLEAAENLARAVEDPAAYWEERCAKAETAYRDVWQWWQEASDEVERLRGELARRDVWPHYTSTYCIHSHHEACRRTCKICEDPCLCECHTEAAGG
jgi:HPt (histidine-containing phosphotransfer) domain-containing protein